MTKDVIRQWISASPFQPFRIHTTNGRTFDIPHPEFAKLLRTTLAVFKPDSDVVSLVSLLHINEFEAVGELVETESSS